MEPGKHVLEVWGDLACFSRPEMKVERFSYPCITPSAARGVFDAIYAKPPEFRWQIRSIEILAPLSYIALRRNEVKDKVNVRTVLDSIASAGPIEPIWADGDRKMLGTDTKGRTQRQTMALKNVRYRVHAELRPWPGHEKKRPALEAQFERRAEKGKCFYQPYLGCREFPAYFTLLSASEAPHAPIPERVDLDVGLMLYDVFDLGRPGANTDAPCISLFRATIRNGVMRVPDYTSDEVLKGGVA